MDKFKALWSKIARLEGKQIAYDNGTRTLTFDGDATGKDAFFVESMQYVRVSGTAIDPKRFEAASVSSAYGVIMSFEKDGFNPALEDGGHRIFVYAKSGTLGIVIVPEDYEQDGATIKKGTYLVNDVDGVLVGGHVWMSRVEYSDIKTIDPKFLPSVNIDLDALGLSEDILYLMSNGGGSRPGREIQYGDFWGKIRTGGMLRLTMGFDGGKQEIIPTLLSTKASGAVFGVVAVVTALYNSVWIRMTINIHADLDSNGAYAGTTRVSAYVEQLA